MGKHLAGVSHHQKCAGGLPFASFPADLHGEVDHGAKRGQRHLGAEVAQFLGREAFQVFAEVDEAEAVDAPRPSTPTWMPL